MLYNGMGDKEKAETLLREVVAAYPHEYQVAYSLGLLLAEKKKYLSPFSVGSDSVIHIVAYRDFHRNHPADNGWPDSGRRKTALFRCRRCP